MEDKFSDTGRFILRLGLAFVFAWLGISKLFLGVMPPLFEFVKIMPTNILIIVLGIIELCISTFLLIGLITRITGFIVALYTVFIFWGVIYLQTMGMVEGAWYSMRLCNDILVLCTGLTVMLMKPGKLSVDSLLRH